MTTRCRQSQQRRPSGTNLLGLCAAMALAAPAILATLSPAAAIPITYNLSPPVMGAVAGPPPGVEQITGTFTLDPTGSLFGPTLNSVNLTVTGPVSPGTYDIPLGGAGAIQSPGEIDVTNAGATAGFSLFFANPLGNAPDNVITIGFFSPNIINITAQQGTAVPATSAVPEPTSLALLGGALGLFLLRRRAGRRHTG